MEWAEFGIMAVKTVLLYAVLLQVVPVMVWAERRGMALMQDRPGPNRVGPLGLFQPIADVVKLFFKENAIPTNVNRFLYLLGPFLVLLPATLITAIIPFGDHFVINGKSYPLQIADLNIGILFLLAISSLGIYGILFGGWASNNKYSLMGAMRSTSQMISYEIPLALGASSAVLFYGTFSLRDMVFAQEGLAWGVLPNWGIFYQPLGFLVFFVSIFAETNRLPFDLPEAEPELVAGFHTEYGSMKFASFFMAEYINLTTASAALVAIYFGGWQLPWISDATLLNWVGSRNALAAVQFLTFVGKVGLFLAFFIWVRFTLPRFRFDQLMSLAWKNLIPLGILNIITTAIVLYWMSLS